MDQFLTLYMYIDIDIDIDIDREGMTERNPDREKTADEREGSFCPDGSFWSSFAMCQHRKHVSAASAVDQVLKAGEDVRLQAAKKSIRWENRAQEAARSWHFQRHLEGQFGWDLGCIVAALE